MNDLLSIGGIFTAFGLSSATGLNAYLPLLATGLLAKVGYLDLGDNFQTLGSWPAILVVAAMFIVDLVGDKIPAVDHIFHTVGMVVHPIAGAIAFASQTGVIDNVNPTLALVIGAATGGSLHLARSAVRPLSTVSTAGIGNPILSTAEDVTSAVLTALAVLIPILAIIGIAVVVWLLWKLWRKAGRALGPSPRPRRT